MSLSSQAAIDVVAEKIISCSQRTQAFEDKLFSKLGLQLKRKMLPMILT